MTSCVSIMFNMNVSFVLEKDDIFRWLYKIVLEINTESHGYRIMELEEFASLQLDKPLPDVRVCNVY